MIAFAALPFEEQLDRISSSVRSGAGHALLDEAAALADAEPLGRLLDELARAGALDGSRSALAEIFDRLADASLQHLFTRASHPAASELLCALGEDALRTWPLDRVAALAYLARTLRRRAPERYARVVAEAQASDAPRALLFASGHALAALARDPASRERVDSAASHVIDALASAPKSISQANAERLLASRVYADPGHFFFELLQNADDAGATEWSAAIESDRVSITHDGEPFSFLDLVGVLSIGQTTKRTDQIGFFGVGFKSVYEICDRPRIHSGALSFEIAHVSIPRAIRSPELDRTRLVLPYARALEPSKLHASALAIPAETLMALGHVRAIDVSGPEGERRAIRGRFDQDRCDLELDGALFRSYLTTERSTRFEGDRPEGRPSLSRVLVAVSRDARGAPIPIDGPTLYAFLPTAERSGLRVLVHARFDVALDRERLEASSSWNEMLLREAGLALAELAARLAPAHSPLSILSAPAELAPMMEPLQKALASALRDRPCLRGAGGELLAPSRACLASDPIARALAGLDLDGRRTLAPLDPRERAVAAALGAATFGASELFAWLTSVLREGDPPPPWLSSTVLEAIDAPAERLAHLPFATDASDRLVAPAHARLARPSFAQLYAGLAPVISSEAHATWPAALRQRVALRSLAASDLVADLRGLLAAQLIEREDALLAAIGEVPDTLLPGLAALPLLRTSNGARASVECGLTCLDDRLAPIADLLARRSPLLDDALRRRHPAAIARMVPTFGLDALAATLEAVPPIESPQRVAALLDREAPRLPRTLAARFASLPLFADRHGVRRPLLGNARALVASARLSPELLPEWPWLANMKAAFVQELAPPEIDASAIARALAATADLPPIAASSIEAVGAFLASAAAELPRAVIEALALAPVWLDREGTPRRTGELRRGVASASLDAFYAAVPARTIAAASTLELLGALGLESRVPASDYQAAIDDLLAGANAPRPIVAAVLNDAARALDPSAVARAAAIPIFADEHGTLRALAAWGTAEPRACFRAGAFRTVLGATSIPLLCADDERLFAPFLYAAGPRPASIGDLARHAELLLDRADALVAALRAHGSELDAAARAEVARLPIFASVRGERRHASELSDRAIFACLLGEHVGAALLDDALLDPGERDLVDLLGATLRPARELAIERLFSPLCDEAALEAQPAHARTLGDLLALRALARELHVELAQVPLGLRADGLLSRGRLYDASADCRALICRLAIARELADAAFARSLPEDGALPRLSARRVADALRTACPHELSRAEHPILADVAPLFAWLREHEAEIAGDESARSALRGAAIFPSQRGTLRAASELVLDPDLPDIGLGWGLASDVPPELARFLRRVFEIDRKTRDAIVAHVLDGLDEARSRDDRSRAAELVAFLAAALDAAGLSPDRLEERVRRNGVRARMQVPIAGGGWAKPRFAWMPADELAERVERFAIDLPPRIELAPATPATRVLLLACGARSDLDDDAIERCLDGAIRSGAEARLCLARYVAARALEAPRLRERWALDSRKWVPSSSGALHSPSTLIWRDELASSLFDERDVRFPHPQFADALPDEAGSRLGFAKVAELPWRALGGTQRIRARPALLAWLEDGLRSGRFSADDLRASFGERLRFTDELGIERLPSELAEQGARELFGPTRGDLRMLGEYPKLARALGIPARPNADMIIAFLVEIGARDDIDETERRLLLRRVPACYERLAELADTRPLPRGAAIAGVRSGSAVLRRIGDPDLRIDEPRGLVATDKVDPLPHDRSVALLRRLWSSGVPDHYAAMTIVRVSAGERMPDLAEAAEALRRQLAPALPRGDASRVRAVASIEIQSAIDGVEVVLDADACLIDGTLYLTSEAIELPTRAAPFLAPDPKARLALLEWLESERSEPPRLRSTAPAGTKGIFARLGDFFRARPESEPEPAIAPIARAAPKPREAAGDVGRSFFRPRSSVGSQLGGNEGWLESRLEAPDFGFAFAPRTLASPWIYAPEQIVTRFDRRAQRWTSEELARPHPRSEAGLVAMNGRLPRGECTLPIPMYGRLVELRAADAKAEVMFAKTGETRVALEADSRVSLRIALSAAPSLEGALPASLDATRSIVPDGDLPNEVHELVQSLAELDDVVVKSFAARDFVRDRYRYDPTYLEDPSVGNFLARLTRGRANEHVAALHSSADSTHLGAGVCYELNTLLCEILRRLGVPAGLATGWVLSDGALSEPDHLWAVAFLRDPRGAPIWLPLDASVTRAGRPLRVPKRPPGRFRPPREREVKPSPVPRWEADEAPNARIQRTERLPIAELHRLLRHLSTKAGAAITEADRERLEEALKDPRSAASLLARMLSGR